MSKHTCLRLLTLTLALAAVPLAAQNFGEITGTIMDSTGAVVPGAKVTVINAGTNQARPIVTNDAGNYSVPFLVPGVYDVRVESPGFKVGSRKGVTVQVGAVLRIDFTLEVGEITQQVEVTGGAPLITTESTALGTVIENKRIVELPLNGRNALQLITLSTNVTVEGGSGAGGGLQGGSRTREAYSIGGQRQMYNRFTLDGAENTDPNFNTHVIAPSVDALQEFKVQTGVYSAEFGRATSQVSATTKSGTNNFHGAAFEFLRNSALDAREWGQHTGQKNPFRRNQFGGTVGGPVIGDKLFFLANYEGTRDRKTLLQTASLATARMRAGDFSAPQVGRRIYDPLTRVYTTDASGNERAVSATQFPNNTIPTARIHPLVNRLWEFYPLPTAPGDTIVRNYERNAPRVRDGDQVNLRFDWNQSATSSWFARYSWGDETEHNASTFETERTSVLTTVKQGILSNTHILTASTVNDFRFAWTNLDNDSIGNYAYTRNIQSELGINGLIAPHPAFYGIASFGFGSGVGGFGGGNPWVARNHTFQIIDNISVVRGRHSLKFGGEWRRDRYNNFGNQRAHGEFTYNGFSTFDPANRNATGYGFADFLLGLPQEASRALGTANSMFRSSGYFLYAQNDWKVTPKLTLNLGLRYENTRPWHDKYRGMLNLQMFDPGVGPAGLLPNTRVPILTRPGSGDFYEGLDYRFHDGIPIQAGDQYIGRGLVHPDNNDLAPRFGVSYSPTNRWTFRTGYGVFYSKDIANAVFDMSRNLAARVLLQSNAERRNSSLEDPWRFQREAYTCTGWSGTCVGDFQMNGNIVGRRSPYVHQWLFNIQHELTQNLAVEAGYQGNAGHKLERFVSYNQAVLKTGPTDARSIRQRQPWPAYGRNQQVDGSVNSNYHALGTKLQRRFAGGLTYLVSFTWSKSIDTGSAIRNNSGDRLWPINSYALERERGLSQFHVGRRFVASTVYELPFGPRKPLLSTGILGKIVGGWQIGAIVTLADGAPTNVGSVGDSFQTGGLGNAPHCTGVSPIPDNRTASKFWNIAAFDATNTNLSWLQGNCGRNVLFRPGTRAADMSVNRNIRILEGHSLQFRFETFNTFNHPVWNAPSTDARNVGAFGRVLTANTMRELQFGLKYIF